mmetsp:Transcript_94763/g.182077  ORF Transcript_94763/g.182077 Transcript_94763/m.182077 type:complete len:109 (-) Transcript_94763:654-980(-)
MQKLSAYLCAALSIYATSLPEVCAVKTERVVEGIAATMSPEGTSNWTQLQDVHDGDDSNHSHSLSTLPAKKNKIRQVVFAPSSLDHFNPYQWKLEDESQVPATCSFEL